MQIFITLFNNIICYPLGAVIKFFFNFTNNYALLIVLFTLVVRFCLFPLAIKQQKSSAEMLRMKPKMDKLQKKYAKDKTKYQEEMSKLYQEEGYNPLSGCLPMLIQMPILIGLYQIVYYPLTYIMWYSQDTVNKIADVLRPFVKLDYSNFKNYNDPKSQLYIAKEMGKHMDKLSFLGHVKNLDFNFLGVDLSVEPKFAFTVLVLIPILCYVSQALSSYLSVRMNKKVQQGQAGGATTNVMMIFLLPLMSVWLSVTFPALVGVYWIISNLLVVVQVLILQKFFSLERLAAIAETKSEKRKQAILDGTAKPSRMAEFAKKAMEAQKQSMAEKGLTQGPAASDEKENELQDDSSNEKADSPEETVKINSKGNKSRSQIKEEQRRRLAKSRNLNDK